MYVWRFYLDTSIFRLAFKTTKNIPLANTYSNKKQWSVGCQVKILQEKEELFSFFSQNQTGNGPMDIGNYTFP